MYTAPTKNITNKYQLRILYELTSEVRQDSLEMLATKTIKSGSRLSNKELELIFHMWLDRFLTRLAREYRGYRFHANDMLFDYSLVDRDGNKVQMN